MKNTFARLFAMGFLIGWLALLAAPVQAQKSEMTFRFESEYDSRIELVLYSSDRRGHQWPVPGRVYVLNPGDESDFRISCLGGEKICYGAWVASDPRTYWGVGRNNKRCAKCCYTCDGSQTRVIGLE
jgi:hypothetical protein